MTNRYGKNLLALAQCEESSRLTQGVCVCIQLEGWDLMSSG